MFSRLEMRRKSNSPKERKRWYQRHSVGISCELDKKCLFFTWGEEGDFEGKRSDVDT